MLPAVLRFGKYMYGMVYFSFRIFIMFYKSTFIETAYHQIMAGVPQIEKTWTRAGLSNFHVVLATAAKSGLHAAKMKLGIQNAGRIIIHIHQYMNRFTCLKCYTSCALKI